MDFKFKDIHIGELIQLSVKEQEIGKDRIADFLKIDQEEIEKMYQMKSMETELLLRWSKLLEYDFFRIFSQHLVWYAPTRGEKTKKKDVKDSKLPQFRKNIYTSELIRFIVELIQSGEKTRSQIIEEYNIPRNTLYRWLTKYEKKQDTEL